MGLHEDLGIVFDRPRHDMKEAWQARDRLLAFIDEHEPKEPTIRGDFECLIAPYGVTPVGLMRIERIRAFIDAHGECVPKMTEREIACRFAVQNGYRNIRWRDVLQFCREIGLVKE